jgi:hypothetical protein
MTVRDSEPVRMYRNSTAVQQPTTENESLVLHRLIEVNHTTVVQAIPNRNQVQYLERPQAKK